MSCIKKVRINFVTIKNVCIKNVTVPASWLFGRAPYSGGHEFKSPAGERTLQAKKKYKGLLQHVSLLLYDDGNKGEIRTQ